MSRTIPERLGDEEPKDASAQVRAANAGFAMPPDDGQDFEDARRGFLGSLPDGVAPGAGSRPAWDMRRYAFLGREAAPGTVNPSLWRQARLNAIHGLFEVMPGVYQIRGLDLANMTLIEGETGVVVIDTLTTRETAAAAIALYREHRGDRPVTGVIFTHTHTDHWGGASALVDPEDVAAGRIPPIAPDRFMEEAVAENVMVGAAMLRRGLFQFGHMLPPGEKGHVDNGLGKAMAVGTWALVPPNDLIRETGETRTVDGVELHFQMAPNTEAPAEMHIWAPGLKLLNMAENASRNFHNLLPFRGSIVRNTLDWSRYINEALEMWGAQAEVLVGQHHWPTWGNARVRDHLRIQRDLYKYVHDQTVRLINLGLTPQEIAETIRLPDSIEAAWHARGYYGALRHNAKAIYQHYLGWYDAVPAHLDPLPPQAGGRRMVEYMGGMVALLRRARADFEAGEFRWVAEVLNRAVFADPACVEARVLLADAYEQLGYACEAATWRNAYLNAAQELRKGPPKLGLRSTVSPQTARALSPGQLFDVLGVRLDGLAAQEHSLALTFRFTDLGEDWVLTLEHGALTWVAGRSEPSAAAILTLPKAALAAAISGERPLPDAIEGGEVAVEGDAEAVRRLFALIEAPAPGFAIVEPKPDRSL